MIRSLLALVLACGCSNAVKPDPPEAAQEPERSASYPAPADGPAASCGYAWRPMPGPNGEIVWERRSMPCATGPRNPVSDPPMESPGDQVPAGSSPRPPAPGDPTPWR